ncbi:MAG: fibronectin type III domain-containing protein [Nitrospirota bacterium]
MVRDQDTGGSKINCTITNGSTSGDCTESYEDGTSVTLSATTDQGSTFSNWSGGECSYIGTCAVTYESCTCTVTMNADKTVTATFTKQYTLAVTKAGTGSGTVISSPAGISCGSDCSENYTSGTKVTLKATPSTGSTFTGWSGGGCTGTGSCLITMDADKTVTATFQKVTNPPTGSIVINGGAEATKSRSVTLTLTASDDSGGTIQMCISNTTSCSSWTTFASTKSWTLSSGSGTKTVYVWFKDKWGNTNTTPYSDTIILDTTAPVNGTVTATPGNTQVTLNWRGFSDAHSGIASYKVVYSTSSTPYSCSYGSQIYNGAGTTYTHTGLTNGKTYYYRVCAIDKAGNMSTGSTTTVKPHF